MLGLIDGLACDAIFLAGLGSKIDHLASLGAERPKTIGGRHVDGLPADRASHLREKVPNLISSRNLAQKTSVLVQTELPPAGRKVPV